MQKNAFILLMLLTLILPGCSILKHRNAYWNSPHEGKTEKTKASFEVEGRGKFSDTLFVIASSGGGSRAAVFTANVLLKLEETEIGSTGNGCSNLSRSKANNCSNLLSEVDAISAVSGSTLPTAYYMIAKADNEVCQTGRKKAERSFHRQKWNKKELRKLMSKNFQLQWIGRWLLPQNIIRFWFTSYDRSDIMTQVFANTLYDRKFSIGTYTFGEICDNRPNIILNATNGTMFQSSENFASDQCSEDDNKKFGSLFTFTDCEFRKLKSSINKYPIANAVMASSAFPAAFNYTTLRNFAVKKQSGTNQEKAYLHLFDGGNRDNLGLESAWRVIDHNVDPNVKDNKFRRIAVLLIDSYTKPKGVDYKSPEARNGFDYLIDSNFFDSVNSLLSKTRNNNIETFSKELKNLGESPDNNLATFFFHLKFDSIKNESLKNRINSIKTSFNISKDEAKYLETAVSILLPDNESSDNKCFNALKNFVAGQIYHFDQDSLPCNLYQTKSEINIH